MSQIVDFVRARIAELEDLARHRPGRCPIDPDSDNPEDWQDEQAWKDLSHESWHTLHCGYRVLEMCDDECECGVPDTVLAMCTAQRRVLDLLDRTNNQGIPWLTLRLRDLLPRILAQPYADHEEFQETWRI